MKNPDKEVFGPGYWRGYWRGFTITGILILALVVFFLLFQKRNDKDNAEAVVQEMEIPANETMNQLAARVFALAETQYAAMDGRLADDRIPKSFVNGKPVDAPVGDWVSGFFPGCLWFVYKYTGDPEFKALAERNTLKLAGLPDGDISHDIGFQINCSYGNAYRATGEEKWLPVIRKGAEGLSSRFSPVVGATKSWDNPKWKYPVIIDNMMNLEILTSASRLFGDEAFLKIAKTHANTTMANHFRPDYTTWHVLDYDPETGKVLSKQTHQGLSDDSAWARGQAWGLYGYTMMYRETGDKAYLEQAENIAKTLLARLPEDGIPLWDFDAPSGDLRDSSAGAIMASAFAELSRYARTKALADSCLDMAKKQVRTLASPDYLAKPGENGNFLLLHGVGHHPNNSEIDTPLSYGDYYFLEAILRLVKRDPI